MLGYDLLKQFEQKISKYTKAPYVVLTDSCTHAIELCLRLNPIPITYSIPNRTYLSVPMLFHKLRLNLDFRDEDWLYEYQIFPTNIWDSARLFDYNMYQTGQLQCLSFGHTKPLEIGHGGAILLDDYEKYKTLKMMAYDGRDLDIVPWEKQKEFKVGYHYNMRLEDAVKGIEMMSNKQVKSKDSQQVRYPDCSKLIINF